MVPAHATDYYGKSADFWLIQQNPNTIKIFYDSTSFKFQLPLFRVIRFFFHDDVQLSPYDDLSTKKNKKKLHEERKCLRTRTICNEVQDHVYQMTRK